MNTAPEAISFACFDRSFLSRPILSILVSIDEFMSSTISTNNTELIRSAFSTPVYPSNIASGVNIVAANISCLNAVCFDNANLMPRTEFLRAMRMRFIYKPVNYNTTKLLSAL